MGLSATRTGAVLIHTLWQMGVTEFVVSPGSRSAPLVLAAAGLDARLHVRIDERTGGFLALGLGRGSGTPAVLICSSGTAAANYLPAVVEADAAGVPLIVLTADRPAALRGTGANQTITQAGLYGGAVRFAAEVGEGDVGYLRSLAARTFMTATGSWPGPVHLNVPLPEPLLETDPEVLHHLEADRSTWVAPVRRPRPPATSGPAPDAASWLRDRRVVVVAGEGAAADADLLPLAARLGIPVIAEPTSGLRVHGAQDGWPVLRMGHWLAASPFADAQRPEVVVQLGRPVLSRPIGALIAAADEVAVFDPLERGWDPGRRADLIVAQRFQDWAADVPAAATPWLERWLAADRIAADVLDDVLDAEGVTEPGTTRDLARAMPAGSQLVVASSLPVRHLNEVMAPHADLRVLGNRGASGIDGFLSSAIGVALSQPDRRTAALAGDLSVLHDMTALVIGPGEPLPSLPIVVLDNDGGGIFDLLPYGRHVDRTVFRRVFTTPHGVPLQGLAITTGTGYTSLDDLAELRQVLDDAWSVPGITLIEVSTSTPEETDRHHRISQAITAAVAAAGRTGPPGR